MKRKTLTCCDSTINDAQESLRNSNSGACKLKIIIFIHLCKNYAIDLYPWGITTNHKQTADAKLPLQHSPFGREPVF